MRLKGIRTTEGHLRDAPLEFSEQLNCIIGARGTCKSTIIETIRFLFNDDPERVSELVADTKEEKKDGPAHRGLIRATLQGGTAQLEIDDDGSVKTLERDVNSEPRLYIERVKAIDEPGVFDRIEIYSQGELQDIATDGPKRLALIDRRHKAEIGTWLRRASELAGKIAAIGPDLRDLRETIEGAKVRLSEGEPLREELAQVRSASPPVSTKMADLRTEFRRGEALQARTAQIAQRYRDSTDLAHEAARQLTLVAEEARALGETGNPRLDEIVSVVARAADTASIAAGELAQPDEIDVQLAAAKDLFASQADEYHEALKEEEAVTEAHKREDRLAEEVSKLDQIEDELNRHRAREQALIAERDRLRNELHELRTQVFRRRLAEVEGINAKHSDVIVLALKQGTQTKAYSEKIESLLEGSRIRDRPKLCSQLAAAIPPADFISLIEAEDAGRLAAVLERDPGQMMRLVSHLGSSDDLYSLEGELPDDELEITMFVDGAHQSVSEMSKGQKATAILPLLLRSADYPLVLDQPEDDLDNRFIYRTLVERVRALKQERQLIFVTHNANIPVVGDAERVFVMEMDRDHAKVNAGDVDDMRTSIVDLLEGGEKAFKRRGATYGYSDFGED